MDPSNSGGRDDDAPQPSGSSGRRSGERQAADGDLLDFNDNPALRREIRNKYRELITSMQENREDMMSPSNNKLTEVLEEANAIFKDVRQPREAALDAQFLVVASDLGKEKASQLFSEANTFDPNDFAERLLNFMGLNRLEEDDDEDQDDVRGYLPEDAWEKLARKAEGCFRRAPTLTFMMGTFSAEPPTPKQRVERQRKVTTKEAKSIMPTQLKQMEESHQEATEKEVERILAYLKRYYEDDPTSQISYYEFVINPDSFSRTVENMFHVSFLIRDGLARMYLDDDKLPCIAPTEEEEMETTDLPTRNQCVLSINIKTWKELIDAFDIANSMIPAPNTQTE